MNKKVHMKITSQDKSHFAGKRSVFLLIIRLEDRIKQPWLVLKER